MDAICNDLAAEHESLDVLMVDLPDAAWDEPTPAARWAVRDQISHLWFFDRTAALAATDEDAFRASTAALMASGDPDAAGLAEGRALSAAELLAAWRSGRVALLAALRPLDPKARLPWYGPSMGATSFATARLMETWAHGQDIVDALGLTRPATARLRHVAHIGVRARPFAYAIRGLTMPAADVRVELVAPDGELWTWGDASATDRVVGPALDFCLVVTQRRHPDDTKVRATGEAAVEWLAIAQAFAGPPGSGRAPGQFA